MSIRILVVDDNRDFAESLADVLELKGYQVDMAFTGEESLRKTKERDYDIIFMDIRLPGKKGVDCLLEIRSFKPSAKVIMMTAYSSEQLLDRAVEMGAWKVLKKPFEIEPVLKLLESAAAS